MVKLTHAGTKEIIKAEHNGNVSSDAIDAVKEATLDYAQGLSARASELASHAGRSTVKASDVKLAAKSI